MSRSAEANRQRRWLRKGREDQRKHVEVDRMLADAGKAMKFNDRVILPILDTLMRGELPNNAICVKEPNSVNDMTLQQEGGQA